VDSAQPQVVPLLPASARSTMQRRKYSAAQRAGEGQGVWYLRPNTCSGQKVAAPRRTEIFRTTLTSCGEKARIRP